jgi:hypothetical protein
MAGIGLRTGGPAVVAGLLLLAACTGGGTDGSGPGSSVPPTTAPERPPEELYEVPDPLPPGPPAAPAVRPGDLLTTPPWPALPARNTPGHAATPAPAFIAQGADDERVAPAATRALVERLCRAGDTVELRTYRDVGHFDIPEAAGADVAAWTGDRLAGRRAGSTCRR